MKKYIVVLENDNGDIEYYGLHDHSPDHAMKSVKEVMTYSDLEWVITEVYSKCEL